MPKQNDLPTPVTVNQRFLAKAAGMEVELPTAITMDQMYLQAIAEGSGGGSGDAYTKAQTDALLDGKVDKVTGKGLSTNDFTDAYKTAVDGAAPQSTTYTKDEVDAALAAKINASDVDASLSDTSTNPVQNRVIQAPLARLTESVESLSGIARAETFTTVANQYVYTNQSFTVPAGKVAIFTASVFYNDSKPNALKVGKNADPEATDEDAILWFHEVGEVSLGALSVSGITQKRNTNIIYYIHAKYTGAGTNAVSLYYRII